MRRGRGAGASPRGRTNATTGNVRAVAETDFRLAIAGILEATGRTFLEAALRGGLAAAQALT